MTLDFEPDFRQKIADSWPASINDEDSLRDWDWKYDITTSQLAQKILDGIAPEYKTDLADAIISTDESLTSDEETTSIESTPTTATTTATTATNFMNKVVNVQN